LGDARQLRVYPVHELDKREFGFMNRNLADYVFIAFIGPNKRDKRLTG